MDFRKHKDDALKTHPHLIPYKELPDIEKEYDQATARETIVCLIIGYEIKRTH